MTIAGGTVSGGTYGLRLQYGFNNRLTMTGGTVIGLQVEESDAIVTISGGLIRLNNGNDIGGLTTMSGGTVAANSAGSTYIIRNLAFHGGAIRAGYGATTGNTFNIINLAGGGGSFFLNTDLAGGASDLIRVTTSAVGRYGVYVTNYGGTPAAGQTVKVVDLPAGSSATFGGGGDVGAYRYGVAKGAAISSSLDSSDYYLYNTLGPSTASRAAMGLSADTVVVWYGEMNEVKKRLGDLRMGAPSGDDFWARVYADRYGVRPGGGGGYTQLMRGVEIGRDNPKAFAGGKKYTGFVLGTGRAGNTFAAGGGGATDSVYAGTYGSWLRDDGSYVDLIGEYN
ncbi:MAG TPA: autotransporter outer membrane beta-barrel domain-containing protein, partial [Negativicutes bacterium]|nr:autotransporter outer membrane beta-barrel domain-containing protein [Negativicutes bacterium]